MNDAEIPYKTWKLISDYLNLRLLPDLPSYYYFFQKNPTIIPRKIKVCVDTPLASHPPLQSSLNTIQQ